MHEEFEVGDLVLVENNIDCYRFYREFITEGGFSLKKWRANEVALCKDHCKVLFKGNHQRETNVMLYILESVTDGQLYVYDNESNGLKKVSAIRKPCSPEDFFRAVGIL